MPLFYALLFSANTKLQSPMSGTSLISQLLVAQYLTTLVILTLPKGFLQIIPWTLPSIRRTLRYSCLQPYGAQNLVTATFEQRPIWPGKKIKINTPDFGPNDAQKYTRIKRTESQCNNNRFFSGNPGLERFRLILSYLIIPIYGHTFYIW